MVVSMERSVVRELLEGWVPACAGMTEGVRVTEGARVTMEDCLGVVSGALVNEAGRDVVGTLRRAVRQMDGLWRRLSVGEVSGGEAASELLWARELVQAAGVVLAERAGNRTDRTDRTDGDETHSAAARAGVANAEIGVPG